MADKETIEQIREILDNYFCPWCSNYTDCPVSASVCNELNEPALVIADLLDAELAKRNQAQQTPDDVREALAKEYYDFTVKQGWKLAGFERDIWQKSFEFAAIIQPLIEAARKEERAATLKEVGEIVDTVINDLAEKMKSNDCIIKEWLQIEVIIGALLKGELPDTGKEK